MKVYAFCNSGNGTDMQTWIAIAETGEILTSHFSSSRTWGIHDVGPEWKAEAYAKVLGADVDVDYIVVDEGKAPPAEVVELNRLLGERAKAAESAE
jgi:hypothetical protein